MTNDKIFTMLFSKVYSLLYAKAKRKGRTKEEVDQVTAWLTGYRPDEITAFLSREATYGDFFLQAPAMNPNRNQI